MTSEANQQFALIYLGLSDRSMEAVTGIKELLVSQLSMTSSQIAELLGSSRYVLKYSDTADELEGLKELLSSKGMLLEVASEKESGSILNGVESNQAMRGVEPVSEEDVAAISLDLSGKEEESLENLPPESETLEPVSDDEIAPLGLDFDFESSEPVEVPGKKESNIAVAEPLDLTIAPLTEIVEENIDLTTDEFQSSGINVVSVDETVPDQDISEDPDEEDDSEVLFDGSSTKRTTSSHDAEGLNVSHDQSEMDMPVDMEALLAAFSADSEGDDSDEKEDDEGATEVDFPCGRSFEDLLSTLEPGEEEEIYSDDEDILEEECSSSVEEVTSFSAEDDLLNELSESVPEVSVESGAGPVGMEALLAAFEDDAEELDDTGFKELMNIIEESVEIEDEEDSFDVLSDSDSKAEIVPPEVTAGLTESEEDKLLASEMGDNDEHQVFSEEEIDSDCLSEEENESPASESLSLEALFSRLEEDQDEFENSELADLTKTRVSTAEDEEIAADLDELSSVLAVESLQGESDDSDTESENAMHSLAVESNPIGMEALLAAFEDDEEAEQAVVASVKEEDITPDEVASDSLSVEQDDLVEAPVVQEEAPVVQEEDCAEVIAAGEEESIEEETIEVEDELPQPDTRIAGQGKWETESEIFALRAETGVDSEEALSRQEHISSVSQMSLPDEFKPGEESTAALNGRFKPVNDADKESNSEDTDVSFEDADDTLLSLSAILDELQEEETEPDTAEIEESKEIESANSTADEGLLFHFAEGEEEEKIVAPVKEEKAEIKPEESSESLFSFEDEGSEVVEVVASVPPKVPQKEVLITSQFQFDSEETVIEANAAPEQVALQKEEEEAVLYEDESEDPAARKAAGESSSPKASTSLQGDVERAIAEEKKLRAARLRKESSPVMPFSRTAVSVKKTETPVEEIAEEAGPEATEGKTSFLSPEVLIPLLVGVALLIGGNYFLGDMLYGAKEEKVIDEASLQKALSAVVINKSNDKKAPLKASADGKEMPYQFSGEEADKTINVSFMKRTNSISAMNFELEMDPSPELTPEEIIVKKQRNPWIAKLNFTDSEFAKKGNTFTGLVRPKMYVSSGGERKRVLGTGIVAITFTKEGKGILEYAFKYQDHLIDDVSTVNGIVPVGDADFAIHMKGSFNIEAAP